MAAHGLNPRESPYALAAVLLLASCSSRGLRVEVSLPEGAKSYILARSPLGGGVGQVVAQALDAAEGPGAIFTDTAYAGAPSLVFVAAFDRPVEDLPLPHGALSLATERSTSIGELEPRWTLRADVSDQSGEVIVAVDADLSIPPPFDQVRFGSECRPRAVDPQSAIDFDRFEQLGCPSPLAERPRICFGAPQRLAPIRTGTVPLVLGHLTGAVIIEGEERYFYFGATHPPQPPFIDWDSYIRHFRGRLRTATVVEDIEELGDIEPLRYVTDHWVNGGWGGRVSPRADGQEMFFDLSYPDGHWWDPELYVAKRVNQRWQVGNVVSRLGAPYRGTAGHDDVTDNDGAGAPVLLPDHRTLLYSGQVAGTFGLRSARRESTAPGDLSFSDTSAVIDEARSECVECGAYSISCDRGHLIYADNTGTFFRVRITHFPTTAQPAPVLSRTRVRLELPERIDGERPSDFTEVPDCSGAYVSNNRYQYYLPRVACP